MVTRKPFPPLSTSPKDKTSNPNPPYPTTPTAHARSPGFTELDRSKTIHSAKSVYSPDLNSSPAFDLIDMHQARQRPQRRDSDVSSHGTWDSDDDGERDATPEEEALNVPKPLRISKSQEQLPAVQDKGKGRAEEELPAILKPGPVGGVQPRKSQEALGYEDEATGNPWASPTEGKAPASAHQQPVSHNPYRQQQPTGGFEPSQNAWQSTQPISNAPLTSAPPPPPVELSTAPKTPSDELKNLTLGEGQPPRPHPQPFETAEILAVPQQGRSPLPSVTEQGQRDSEDFYSSNPWQSQERAHAVEQTAAASPPRQVSVGPAQLEQQYYPPPPPGPPPSEQQYAQAPASASHEQQHYPPPPGPPPKGRASTSLIDHEEPPSYATPSEQQARPHPAPISTAPTQSVRSTESVPETPGTRSRRQRSEHYQIKHINWYDGQSGMRRSPILTQNANGPCPLLALVNALVLTTPRDQDTALVETLRTREQVSLGLLLDAVFDELMSGRRGDSASELPDVSELYAFLLALHTGMNVNPRFITPATAPRGSLDLSPPEKAPLHPAARAHTKAGCFEETKEMRLYSTFNVPLIHGWTAPVGTPAYAAFERCAQTFEEAQNMQFLEPELEDKLRSEGLEPGEQQTLQDIQTIRQFLSTWSTQLTDYGLETISSSLRAGQTAILFRNDHFSTVYKEPRHGALMTLVTDAGYGGHDEIVWESLVDVNGSASEMFSGDFRTVSHGQDVRLNQNSSGGGEEGWQTVQRRQPSGSQNEIAPPLPGPRPQQPVTSGAMSGAAVSEAEALDVVPDQQRKTSEQQDHDLALALQLQEEEEDQQRQADQRRRREQELSERFLSTESTSPTSPEGPRPPIPPRRSVNNTTAGRASNVRVTSTGAPSAGRPSVTRPAGGDDPDAPPSYEQSRSDRRYTPAGATAQAGMQQGNPLNAYDALRRQHQQGSTTSVNGPASPVNRRHSQVPLSGVGGAGNRVRRRSSQMAAMPGTYGSGSMAPQQQHQGQQMQGGRPVPGQAAGVRDAEEKCVVM